MARTRRTISITEKIEGIRKIARTYEEKKKSATIVGCTFLFIQIFDFVLAGILPE